MSDVAESCAELTRVFESLAAQNMDLLPEIYERFFQLCPQAESLISHSDDPMRGRMLEQTFHLLMDPPLQGPDGYFRWEIANHLSAYGVTLHMYTAYFQAIGEIMTDALDSEWTSAVDHAWQHRVEDLLGDVLAA